MTIQEEIRDAVMPILKDIQDEGYLLGTSCLSVHYNEILRVLHSKGLVIQGDKFQVRLLDTDPWQIYYEVEPLIEVAE